VRPERAERNAAKRGGSLPGAIGEKRDRTDGGSRAVVAEDLRKNEKGILIQIITF